MSRKSPICGVADHADFFIIGQFLPFLRQGANIYVIAADRQQEGTRGHQPESLYLECMLVVDTKANEVSTSSKTYETTDRSA